MHARPIASVASRSATVGTALYGTVIPTDINSDKSSSSSFPSYCVYTSYTLLNPVLPFSFSYVYILLLLKSDAYKSAFNLSLLIFYFFLGKSFSPIKVTSYFPSGSKLTSTTGCPTIFLDSGHNSTNPPY